MSTVDVTTGEIVEFDRAAAERRAERITLRLESIADNTEAVKGMIREAVEKRDDVALGYRSLGEYVSDRFGGSLSRLGIEVRRAFVSELTQAGMSTRAIAPVVGVNQATVVRDVARDAGASPQTPEPAIGGEAEAGSGQTLAKADAAPNTSASEIAEAGGQAPEQASSGEAVILPPPPAPPVVGIDGKTYPRPARPRPALKVIEDEWTEQDRAEELARNLSQHLSLMYALTNPERRAEFVSTWALGIRDIRPLGADFITPQHMRDLSAALLDFATEWENQHG